MAMFNSYVTNYQSVVCQKRNTWVKSSAESPGSNWSIGILITSKCKKMSGTYLASSMNVIKHVVNYADYTHIYIYNPIVFPWNSCYCWWIPHFGRLFMPCPRPRTPSAKSLRWNRRSQYLPKSRMVPPNVMWMLVYKPPLTIGNLWKIYGKSGKL